MLVTDGDGPNNGEARCLLGRRSSWAPKVYSTLAGFVEPGESLEEAVAREVHEETGIEVRKVRYHSSQPWPFPSSLMLGFTAVATNEEIRLQTDELEDARWFTQQDLEERKGVQLPSEISIARRLIEDWLAGEV
jgi:NAD+ diphosphatase